jgi:hypothetical protein
MGRAGEELKREANAESEDASAPHEWHFRWPLVAIGVMAAAWLLPFGEIQLLGVGSSEANALGIRFWQLAPALPLLLVPLIALGALAVCARWGRSALALLVIAGVALAGNTYLASSVADRNWRDMALPSPLAGSSPTLRCDVVELHAIEGERSATFSCAFGLGDPVRELQREVALEGFEPNGLPSFSVGLGVHLYLAASFLLAGWALWHLLRRKMKPLGAGLALGVSGVVLCVLMAIDGMSHLR